jgi:hypothetical protein
MKIKIAEQGGETGIIVGDEFYAVRAGDPTSPAQSLLKSIASKITLAERKAREREAT